MLRYGLEILDEDINSNSYKKNSSSAYDNRRSPSKGRKVSRKNVCDLRHPENLQIISEESGFHQSSSSGTPNTFLKKSLLMQTPIKTPTVDAD